MICERYVLNEPFLLLCENYLVNILKVGTLFKDEEHASDTINGEKIHCNGVQVEFGE